MTGKNLAAGWVIQLTLRQLKQDVEPGTRAPTFQFFNVAISSPDKAIEAARSKAGAPTDAPMRIVRVSHQEIAALSLHAGHVTACGGAPSIRCGMLRMTRQLPEAKPVIAWSERANGV